MADRANSETLGSVLWKVLVDPFLKPDVYALLLGLAGGVAMSFVSAGIEGWEALKPADFIVPAALFVFLYLHNYKRKYPPLEPLREPTNNPSSSEATAAGPATPRGFRHLSDYFEGVVPVRGGAVKLPGDLEALVVLTLTHDAMPALIAFDSIASRHGSKSVAFIGASAAGPAACELIATAFPGSLCVPLAADAGELVKANAGGKGVVVLKVVAGQAGPVWNGHIGALERFLSDNFGGSDSSSDSDSGEDGASGEETKARRKSS